MNELIEAAKNVGFVACWLMIGASLVCYLIAMLAVWCSSKARFDVNVVAGVPFGLFFAAMTLLALR